MEVKDIINALGGSTLLSEYLTELTGKKLSPQAVNQWKARGIPRRRLLQHPDLFAKGRRLAKKNISLP